VNSSDRTTTESFEPPAAELLGIESRLRLRPPRSQVLDLCMPGPIFNWFCVAHSIVDVLSNAAVIRASQVYPRTAAAAAAVPRNLKRRTAKPVNLDGAGRGGLDPPVGVDLGVKMPSNALDGTGGASIGAYVRWARHLAELIEVCRYTFNPGAHRSGITWTSVRVRTYSPVSPNSSDTSHRPAHRRTMGTRTTLTVQCYAGNPVRHSFSSGFYRR